MARWDNYECNVEMKYVAPSEKGITEIKEKKYNNACFTILRRRKEALHSIYGHGNVFLQEFAYVIPDRAMDEYDHKQHAYLQWLTRRSPWSKVFKTKVRDTPLQKLWFNTNFPADVVLTAGSFVRWLDEYKERVEVWYEMTSWLTENQAHLAAFFCNCIDSETLKVSLLGIDSAHGGLYDGFTLEAARFYSKGTFLNELKRRREGNVKTTWSSPLSYMLGYSTITSGTILPKDASMPFYVAIKGRLSNAPAYRARFTIGMPDFIIAIKELCNG